MVKKNLSKQYNVYKIKENSLYSQPSICDVFSLHLSLCKWFLELSVLPVKLLKSWSNSPPWVLTTEVIKQHFIWKSLFRILTNDRENDGNDESSKGKLSNLLVHKVVPLSLMRGLVSFAKLHEWLNCERAEKILVYLIIGNHRGAQRTFSIGFHHS